MSIILFLYLRRTWHLLYLLTLKVFFNWPDVDTTRPVTLDALRCLPSFVFYQKESQEEIEEGKAIV